jgi:hypothetical protein
LGLYAVGLLAGEEEVAGQGLADLGAPPFRLHDASGGVARGAEKEMAKLVGHYATQENGKLEVGVVAKGAARDFFVVDGSSLKETELALTAGWGHAGKGGVTMPGKGKATRREYSDVEREAILDGARRLGLSEKEAFAHLGETTCDVYLNDAAYWSNVPIRVWEYTIGGYQVIKKWLSYREQPLLGRPPHH